MDAGVLPEHITLMEKCTYENPETLFSHRRDRNGTGDMAGFIKIA
jgi:copper oxidase (laccase) domain-containing protein